MRCGLRLVSILCHSERNRIYSQPSKINNDCLASIRQGSNRFFFQAEDGIRDLTVTGVQTVCSSDLHCVALLDEFSESAHPEISERSGQRDFHRYPHGLGCNRGRGEMALMPREAARSVAFASGSDRKSTRLNSSHSQISYAVFCLKKK